MALSRLRRTFRMLLLAAVVVVLTYTIWTWATAKPEDPRARRVGPFLATPYLQLGDDPKADDLALLWHADDVDAAWSVEVRSPLGADWRTAGSPTYRPVRLDGVERHRVYRAILSGLTPGERFAYRVRLGSATAFATEARAKPAPGAPQAGGRFSAIARRTASARRKSPTRRIGSTLTWC